MTWCHPRARWSVLGALLLALVLADAGAAQGRKPKAPPGRDPGGIAVAVIGHGVDYLRPEIAPRIARDGEGEPIAWDLGDNDNRPIERGSTGAALQGANAPHSALAHLVLREAGATRLVVARRKPGDRDGLARATAFAAQTPARIVLVLHDGVGAENWGLLREAAQHFRRQLLIVPVAAAVAIDAGAPLPADFGAANVITVTTPRDEQAMFGQTWPVVRADIAAASVLDLQGGSSVTGLRAPLGPEAAAARVAALAARLLAVEPQLDGAGLKARIVGLARPPAQAASEPPTLAEPQRPFRLE